MTNRPNYYQATNQAYAVLKKLGITTLPIDVFQITNFYRNITLITYSQFCSRRGIAWEELVSLNVSDKGFTVKKGDLYVMFYNDKLSDEVIRFTLAHEFGHYILNHHEDNSVTDKEANCFARNILSPIPITDYLGITEVKECCDTFFISPYAAEVVLDKCNLDRANIKFDLYQSLTNQFTFHPSSRKTISPKTIRPFSSQKSDYALDWDSVIGY